MNKIELLLAMFKNKTFKEQIELLVDEGINDLESLGAIPGNPIVERLVSTYLRQEVPYSRLTEFLTDGESSVLLVPTLVEYLAATPETKEDSMVKMVHLITQMALEYHLEDIEEALEEAHVKSLMNDVSDDGYERTLYPHAFFMREQHKLSSLVPENDVKEGYVP